MNMAVDLSWWFQQRCLTLFVHQTMNSLFQHAWTSLSTTLFKAVNNHVQASQLNHVQTGQLNHALHVQACQQAKPSCVFLRVYGNGDYQEQ